MEDGGRPFLAGAPIRPVEIDMTMDRMQDHRAALLAQCPPLPELPEAEAAALPIHVTHWGRTGPTVLVVHGGVQGGLGGGPSTFSAQEALVERGWQFDLVDRPGFGRSPSRGVDDMERDAVWIAGMMGDGRHLMGHSWGGASSLLAAARRPDAVRSLVLVEPALMPLLMRDPSLNDDPTVAADARAMAGRLLSARTPGDYALAFARGLGAPDGSGASNPAVAALERDPGRAAAVGCALLRGRMASDDAMRHAAEEVRRAEIPVLVVTGGWSPSFDAIGAIARPLRAAHRRGRVQRGRRRLPARGGGGPSAAGPERRLDAVIPGALFRPCWRPRGRAG